MKQLPVNRDLRRAVARAFELHEAGKTWEQAVEILKDEKVLDAEGKPYTLAAMKQWNSKSRWGGVKAAELYKSLETVAYEEVSWMMQELEARLTTLIDDKLGKGVRVGGAAPFGEDDRPPKPPKTGKKFIGDKGDLRARIDKALLDRLERDCKDRFGGNMSATLDALLWLQYGKPRLSFETDKGQTDE